MATGSFFVPAGQDARGDRLDQAAKTMEELSEIHGISARRREIAGEGGKATP
jgi:hypothetical protein